MQETIETRIRRLEALVAIERLIADLGRAFDSGPSAQALRALFAEDATFEIDRYGTLTGRDAIAEGVAGNADTGFSWTLHYLVSPRIDLSSDLASAEIGFMLWEPASAASGKAYWIGGSYAARAAEIGGQWQFTWLRLNAELISHYPEGWHDMPAALAEA
ncbi:nuclear transport factor 2 family protein [Novosphingobium mangrovi (ex Huang et al. 2023)]|uniref:Nuclear transport factor 2 family protein n=1 Tax=Novosphingobium mangrovi (ex Huang et al. 2023) TaxID=2976432 RepID=A0ABT2I2I3_9SPHN|nr:nuclear transport factor 2 family protein [Novosphingobium mangrovi (ex Huang et al. 2023)]MCT2398817.1 nuclear transport factor 2 family protein [Novosphingobium mangrovi (ex Huang et al. 2023)]